MANQGDRDPFRTPDKSDGLDEASALLADDEADGSETDESSGLTVEQRVLSGDYQATR